MFWDILPWLLSALTLSVAFLTGQKWAVGWVSGIVAQFFWIAFIVHTAAWGLMPTSIFLIALYAYNWRKWVVV